MSFAVLLFLQIVGLHCLESTKNWREAETHGITGIVAVQGLTALVDSCRKAPSFLRIPPSPPRRALKSKGFKALPFVFGLIVQDFMDVSFHPVCGPLPHSLGSMSVNIQGIHDDFSDALENCKITESVKTRVGTGVSYESGEEYIGEW